MGRGSLERPPGRNLEGVVGSGLDQGLGKGMARRE